MSDKDGLDLAANERAARRCLWAGETERARPYLLASLRAYLRRVYAGTLNPDEAVTALAVALLARGPAGVQAIAPAIEACLDLYGDAGRLRLVAQVAAVALAYPSPPEAPPAPLPPAEAAVARALQAVERRDGPALAEAMRTRHALLGLVVADPAQPEDGGDLVLGALAQLALHRGCPVPDDGLGGIVPAALAEKAPTW